MRCVFCNRLHLYHEGHNAIPNLISQAASFQTVIEFVEAFSEDEQDQLFDLIPKRRITRHCQDDCSKCRYNSGVCEKRYGNTWRCCPNYVKYF